MGTRRGIGIRATLLVSLAAGCHSGPSAAMVKVGMDAQEVRAAFGNPLITGTYRNTIPGGQTVQERWTFKQGDDALVVIMENGKVKQAEPHKDPTTAMRSKVREGMTRAQVRAAIGVPAVGDNPKDPNPNPNWQYMDPVAPVHTLMVAFQGETVKSIQLMPNMAYGSP